MYLDLTNSRSSFYSNLKPYYDSATHLLYNDGIHQDKFISVALLAHRDKELFRVMDGYIVRGIRRVHNLVQLDMDPHKLIVSYVYHMDGLMTASRPLRIDKAVDGASSF